jgi:hypothetical protein
MSEAADVLSGVRPATGPIFTTLTSREQAAIDVRASSVSEIERRDATRVVLAPPRDAREAQERLDDLSRNADWNKRLFAGDAGARRELDALNEMIAAGQPLDDFAPDARARLPVIETVANGEMTHSEHIRHIEHLREIFDAPDNMIREWETGINSETGRPFVEADFERARLAKSKLFSDPNWTERYEAGGKFEKLQVAAIHGILIHAPGRR